MIGNVHFLCRSTLVKVNLASGHQSDCQSAYIIVVFMSVFELWLWQSQYITWWYNAIHRRIELGSKLLLV